MRDRQIDRGERNLFQDHTRLTESFIVFKFKPLSLSTWKAKVEILRRRRIWRSSGSISRKLQVFNEADIDGLQLSELLGIILKIAFHVASRVYVFFSLRKHRSQLLFDGVNAGLLRVDGDGESQAAGRGAVSAVARGGGGENLRLVVIDHLKNLGG